MNHKLTKTDLRRVATVEKFLKNANHQLKKKSIEEQTDIFEFQEKIIKGISDIEYRDWLLAKFIELKESALLAKSKFDNTITNLENCEKLLKWKNLDEIWIFFDGVDKDIYVIPDQRMRQMLIKQTEYWREKMLEDTSIRIMEERIAEVENNHFLAWEIEDEVNRFFDEIDFDIFKSISNLPNKSIYKYSFLLQTSMIRDTILREVKYHLNNEDFIDFLNLDSITNCTI